MAVHDTRRKNWEDLDVTKEELKNLTDCLQNEEFRKLLRDYAEEVTNPENRKLYEKEITQLEKERGVDVTFVNPEPGYVIKTSVDGCTKCFINISQSITVAKPTSQPSYEDGCRGLRWSIPHTLAPPRDDLDKKKSHCVVFDVVFHPDTIHLASKNVKFRDTVNQTAMDSIEKNCKVKLDRNNIRFPKLRFKGSSQPTVIRRKHEKPVVTDTSNIEPEIYQKLMSSYDENREKSWKLSEEPRRSLPTTRRYKENGSEFNSDSTYTIPKYLLKEQNDIDLHHFHNHKNAKLHITIPKKLVVVIELPLIESVSNVTLDVQEKCLSLTSEKPAKYKLHLPLPYAVNPDGGDAKFDSKLKKLTVTLIVKANVGLYDNREDSGVESEHGSPPIDSGDEIGLTSMDFKRLHDSPNNDKTLITEIVSDNTVRECEDTSLRTSSSVVPFLNPNFKYSLPTFSCNVYDKMLAFTIHLKNVDPASIRSKILSPDSGFHITLTSVGAGFFPVYYSLCIKLGEHSIDPTSLTIEPWDNNVILNIVLMNTDNLSNYHVGLDEDLMELKELPTVVSLKNKLDELMIEPKTESEKNIEVIAEGDDVVINITPSQMSSDNELEQEVSLPRRGNRSVSESSSDEIEPNHSTSARSKGILKYGRGSFGRSVSESSSDYSNVLVSLEDCHWDPIPEMSSESSCSSFKKTVRFNDIVARQLYRSNSSILGQRKKNQRKLRNKKRAHERRTSESENSESEERDKFKVYAKNVSEEVDNCENVKPILTQHKSVVYKQSESINIANEKNTNSYQSKRNHQSTNEISWHAETRDQNKITEVKEVSKNDLIFDLDM